MRAIQQLLCSLRRGHQWETTEDAFGGTTVCSRCGKLHHRRWSGEKPADTSIGGVGSDTSALGSGGGE